MTSIADRINYLHETQTDKDIRTACAAGYSQAAYEFYADAHTLRSFVRGNISTDDALAYVSAAREKLDRMERALKACA